MTKQRRAVSLDEEVDQYLGREGVNASQLVNKLVKKHMNGNASGEEIREFRKQQVKSEYEELATRARRKIEEYNELEEREERDQTIQGEERREYLQKLQMVPNDPTHPLVEDVAESLGETPETVLEEVAEL